MLKSIKAAVRRVLERKTFSLSQAGQDIWVFGEVFNEETKRFFVDVGAHDGIFLSNTFVLENRYRWSGICVETNQIVLRSLERIHA